MSCFTCFIDGECWAAPEHRRKICEHAAEGHEGYRRLIIEKSRGVEFGNGQTIPHEPSDRWLSPLRSISGRVDNSSPTPWEGMSKVKPWERKVTAAIVHIDTPDLLRIGVDLLRHQTERPHIIIIDVGSQSRHRGELEALEAEDVEVHYIRPRGWRATSQPVACGMDVAQALVQTEFMYATHTDVFLKKREFLSYLLDLCNRRTPIVGWQMSPRPAWPDNSWEHIPSHSATMYHVPTLRRHGLQWSMLAAFERLGIEPHNPVNTGYPDTEVNLGLGMLAAGFKRWDVGTPPPDSLRWLCLGPEPNAPYETEWFEHIRSTTGNKLFNSAQAQRHAARLESAVTSAKSRITRWNKPRVNKGKCGPCEAAKANRP